jgi:acyl carrier protein
MTISAVPKHTEGIEQAVLSIAREVLGRPALRPDQDFFDVGVTSLAFVRLLVDVQRQLKVHIRPADIEETTARGLAALVVVTEPEKQDER